MTKPILTLKDFNERILEPYFKAYHEKQNEELIEKVAKAIYDISEPFGHKSFENLNKLGPAYTYYKKQAKAAIKVLLENL